ncbi:LysE family translocator [Dyella tabacisoli]|uniref:LysE family translocator n=1 Tax=Dyella tabacisoli TaxID=2282381 RepID=A0A369UQH8_9GAMM|nr:LysE family translocator [Dyella tabacisoli]RDD83022.1 LysE family translocator [Dyella tabacisoli]
MTHYAHLWLFFAVVFGVIALPGLDMAFVLGSALSGGRRKGMAAVGGIVAGGVCHVTMTALGIGMLLKLIPGVFNAVLLAGALYIAWIGLSLLRSTSGFDASVSPVVRPQRATFWQGMFTALLNPKAYLFMLAIFPQFLRPAYGALWVQALVLWGIIAITQFVVYGGIALTADAVRAWLKQRPSSNMLATRWVGILLIAAALFTGVEGWRGI